MALDLLDRIVDVFWSGAVLSRFVIISLVILAFDLHANAIVNGNVITFPSDGNRWKVFDFDTRRNVCLSWQDGLTCEVDPGSYSIINVTLNTRTTVNIVSVPDAPDVPEDSEDIDGAIEYDVLVDNLNQPVAIVALDADTLLVGEKAGKMLIISTINDSPSKSTFLELPSVDKQGEKGLLNIVLDPQFDQNNYFYVYYQNSAAGRSRISRFTSQGSAASLSSETLIWEDNIGLDSQTNTDHWGGGMAFGPNGHLYLAMGDKKDRPSDSQDLSVTAGKLMRLDVSLVDVLGSWQRDAENLHIIPDDNPFVDGPGGNLDEIWAIGLRNPYRIFWENDSGTLYITDVGGNVQSGADASHEDVHTATAADAGVNFGWPQCEGPDCSGTPPVNYSAPVFSIKHTDARAIIGGVVYGGTQLPEQYHGAFFFTDYTKGWLRYISLDENRNLVSDTPVGGNVFAGNGMLGRPVSVIEGLNGELLYLDIVGFNATGGGRIGRIAFSGANKAPVIESVAVNPTNSPLVSSSISFEAIANDPDGTSLLYTWDFGDGNTGQGASTAYQYSVAGSYQVRLTVSDGELSRSSNEVTVSVGSPPTVEIDSSLDGLIFRAGDTIQLSGFAEDEGAQLFQSDYKWSISFLHDDHRHPVTTEVEGYACLPEGSNCLDFTIPSTGHDFSGTTGFEVILAVTDIDGLVTTDRVNLFPDKVDITINTNLPQSIDVEVDDIPFSTPTTIDTLIGFQHILGAPSEAIMPGSAYAFARWESGEVETELTFIVPEVSTSYEAEFELVGQTDQLIIDGTNVTFPSDGNRWKLYDRSGRRNVCLSWLDGLQCAAEPGDYTVINVTTNERQNVTLQNAGNSEEQPDDPQEPAGPGSPVVDGNVITFPNDGNRWKAYDLVANANVCLSWQSGLVCTVDPGSYSLINVTQGTRNNIEITALGDEGPDDPTDPVDTNGEAVVDGNIITFPNDGNRWKVYDLVSRSNVCLSWVDGLVCAVETGRYSIINVTENKRFNVDI